jgi:regulator of replication initiation timing
MTTTIPNIFNIHAPLEWTTNPNVFNIHSPLERASIFLRHQVSVLRNDISQMTMKNKNLAMANRSLEDERDKLKAEAADAQKKIEELEESLTQASIARGVLDMNLNSYKETHARIAKVLGDAGVSPSMHTLDRVKWLADDRDKLKAELEERQAQVDRLFQEGVGLRFKLESIREILDK